MLDDKTPSPLGRALLQILKPLARLLLRNGVAYAEFAEHARRAFVECVYELRFQASEAVRIARPHMFIVETKSARGNGIADKILRGLHLHPTKRCSKYCIGMAATGQVTRRNRFLPALRQLHLLAPVQAA